MSEVCTGNHNSSHPGLSRGRERAEKEELARGIASRPVLSDESSKKHFVCCEPRAESRAVHREAVTCKWRLRQERHIML